MSTSNEGDTCLLVTGHVENHDKEEKLLNGVFARGYDENGVSVAETLDNEDVRGSVTFDIEPGETREFVLHMNPSDGVQTIRVFGGSFRGRLTGPTTPIPDKPSHARHSPPGVRDDPHHLLPGVAAGRGKELQKRATSRSPSPRHGWSRRQSYPRARESVELGVPTLWLEQHNTSNNPDEITVSFPRTS